MPTKALVAGTFDLLHPGHLFFLKNAKEKGGFLIVVIARDKSVLKTKKHLPHFNERHRLANLKKIKIADQVILGQYGDKLAIIKKLKPDIIYLGYDQKPSITVLKKLLDKKSLKPQIYRLKAYKPRLYKSSLLAKKRNLC